jgi:hypothetical protein
MSIFKRILAKIFPSDHPANADASSTPATPSDVDASVKPDSASVRSTVASNVSGPLADNAAPQRSGSPEPTAVSSAGNPTQALSNQVDVEAILSDMQSRNSEKLNWKTSIVDLLKLLGLDSSLDARKQLADELHYTGSKDDTAAMNIWLHKEVMRQFAQNGGKVPAGLGH